VSVQLSECWGRDGIQSELPISTDSKLAVLDAAGRYGATRVELTSLAHPEVWPQFADATDVVARYARHAGVEYLVYVPNIRGYERLATVSDYRTRVDTVLVALAVTDSYNLKNVRRDTAAALAEIAQVMAAASSDGLKIIGCVGTAWWCPVDGPVASRQVLELAGALGDLGANEIMLGDTTGEANPHSVALLVNEVREAISLPVIGHFHDMRATAMANALAAIDAGVAWIDCALGGVGGHPPDEHQSSPAGNLCSEDFAALASACGLVDGLDLALVLEAGQAAETSLGRRLQSRVQQAGLPHQLTTTESSALDDRVAKVDV
jgi:hydroxymethylglutaryl-CoA lyase